MKTLMNVLMLPVVIVGLCGITDAENIVTDGLVSYWTFDRDDIIGHTVKDVSKMFGAKTTLQPYCRKRKIDEHRHQQYNVYCQRTPERCP